MNHESAEEEPTFIPVIPTEVTTSPTVIPSLSPSLESDVTSRGISDDEARDEEPSEESTVSLSLDDVKSRWKGIIREATKINASLTLALENAHPVKAEGDHITIAVRFPFHRDRLAEPKTRLTLKQAFDTILEVKTRLTVVVEKMGDAPEGPREESLISQALAALGGSVV